MRLMIDAPQAHHRLVREEGLSPLIVIHSVKPLPYPLAGVECHL